MKRAIFLYLMVLGLFVAGCGSNDDNLGDWSKASAFAGKPRSGAVSFKIGEVVYIGLGYADSRSQDRELKDFWKFENGGWSQLNDFGGKARFAAVAFVVNGKAYVGTGYRANRSGQQLEERLRDFWEYTPETDSWVQVQDMPGDARRDAIAFSLGNKGYVGTGSAKDNQALKDFYSYTPGSGWTVVNGYPGDPCYGASAFVIGDAAIVCLGTMGYPVTDVVKFTEANGWQKMAPLVDRSGQSWDNHYDEIPRAYAMCFVAGVKGDPQRGYIVSGARSIVGSSAGGITNTCFEYDIEKDRWDEVTELPAAVAAARMQGVGFSVNGYGFITLGGGGMDAPAYQDTWMFIPGIDETDKNDY